GTMVGALLHLVYLGLAMLVLVQIIFALFVVGSLVAWVVVLFLLFSSWRNPVDNLLVGLLPIASLLLLIAAITDVQAPLPELSYALTWHILLSILAYSVFSIAAVQSILLWLQDRALKARQTRGLVQALPSLQTMDALLVDMTWLGRLLVSAACAMVLPVGWDFKAQQLLHKAAFASTGWVVFATLLFGRCRFGGRGMVASRWTL